MTLELGGIHQLTAVSAKIRDNVRFYTGTLGMRLVKKSITQDDVSAYHLFYADGHGSAGCDLTFFDWPVQPERRGTRSIVRTALRVSGAGTLDWWHDRLQAANVAIDSDADVDGRADFGVATTWDGAWVGALFRGSTLAGALTDDDADRIIGYLSASFMHADFNSDGVDEALLIGGDGLGIIVGAGLFP